MAPTLPSTTTATAPWVFSRSARLADLGQALLAQPLGGGVEVAVGLCERLLGVHHPGAGGLAQGLDVLGGELAMAACAPGLVRAGRRWRSAAALGCSAAASASAGSLGAASLDGGSASASATVGLGGRVRSIGGSAACSAAAAGRAPAAMRASRSCGGERAWRRASACCGGDCGLLARRCAGGGRRRRAAAPAGGDEATLLDGVGDDAAHERAGADGVVVAGDDVLDDVGVAVGVDDGDDRDAELVGLGDGDVLLLRVEDEDGVGQLLHAADAAEVALELLELAAEQERFLLGHGLELAGGPHALVLLSSCATRLEMVSKLVSMPPSQRSLMYGMPHFSA